MPTMHSFRILVNGSGAPSLLCWRPFLCLKNEVYHLGVKGDIPSFTYTMGGNYDMVKKVQEPCYYHMLWNYIPLQKSFENQLGWAYFVQTCLHPKEALLSLVFYCTLNCLEEGCFLKIQVSNTFPKTFVTQTRY